VPLVHNDALREAIAQRWEGGMEGGVGADQTLQRAPSIELVVLICRRRYRSRIAGSRVLTGRSERKKKLGLLRRGESPKKGNFLNIYTEVDRSEFLGRGNDPTGQLCRSTEV